MKRFVPANEEESAINLTPMLDVVFIMLIFFVVTASFLREAGLPLALPSGGFTVPDDVESISVVVEADRSFRVNGRVVTRGNLLPYLYALRGQNPEAGFGVLVARDSKVDDLVAAADAGRAIGFDTIPITRYD